MSEFIKLTLTDGGPFYLSKSSPIIGMHRVASPQNEGTVLLLGATNRVVTETPEEIMAMLEVKTNQFPGLMAHLDEALRQRDEATQKYDELPAANKALKSANEILFDTLTARTAQVDSLAGRLSNVLQLNGDLQAKTHLLNSKLQEALRQRDEATRNGASFKAAYLSVTSG